MKRKYYPNNWDAIKQCPSSYFPEMEYEDFRDWKVFGYQLPSSHYGVVRIEDLDKGTIEEYTYKTEHHTKQRLKKEVGKNVNKCYKLVESSIKSLFFHGLLLKSIGGGMRW